MRRLKPQKKDCYEKIACNFPKRRIKLPEKYISVYNEHYLDSRLGRTSATRAASKMEQWLHKKVAGTANGGVTLEIGAGTLNQLEYEDSGEAYDIVEPYEMLYCTSKYQSYIRHIYSDISEICMLNSGIYDRITSVACFEHILNLPEVVKTAEKLLKKDGVLSVAIPNEGHFLWHMAYSVTTGTEFKKKTGLEYETLMCYEHVNTADEIETVLKYFFTDVKVSYLGVSRKLSLYRYYECRKERSVR